MTSSGLLDKAKAREDEVTQQTEDAELVESAAETVKDVAAAIATNVSSGHKNPLFRAGVAVLIASMVGLFYLKYLPGIAVLAVFLASFGIAGYGYTGGYKIDASNSKKWISLGIAWLILGGIPYIGGANSGGNISVSLDVENPLDESTNTLNFEYYSSGGLFGSGVGEEPITITVEQDGVIVWSGEVPGDGDHGDFSISLNDIYASNSLYVSDIKEVTLSGDVTIDAAVTSERVYTLTAESSKGVMSNNLELTPSLMTRTIDDIDLEMSLLRSQGGENEVEGVILKGWFGYMTSQYDGALRPSAVASDYSVVTTIEFNEGIVLDYPAITVDGTTATWDGAVYGDGAGKVGESGSDFDFEGSEESTDLDGVTYFQKDDIYEDDGCYTFTVVITNNADFADGQVTVTESVFYEWDASDASDETLEAVSSC